MFPDYEHGISSSSSTYLVNLRGDFEIGDTYSTGRNVGRDLCTITDEVAEENNMSYLLVDGKIIKTSMEPFQHHQRSAFIDDVSK